MIVKDRVSIVTPVYNGEQYLSPMLDSVLGQTYAEIEMILVDDGSTDQTVQVAESYRPRFAGRGYSYRIIQAKHKCAAAAINQGLPYVTGEYLIWPDGDDRLEQDSVEKRVRFLQKYPQYQCVRTLPYYFKQETRDVIRAEENIGDYTREELFWDLLEYRTYVCCGCYMLRAEKFFEIYDKRHIPEYHVGQNYQMLLPFMFLHKCPTIPEKLYGVCVREGSHSRKNLTYEEEKQKDQEYEDMIDEIADICHIDDEASKKRMTYWKLKRRYALAVKYRCGRQIFLSCCQMYRLYPDKKLGIFSILKDFVWGYSEKTWVIRRVYPVYRDFVYGCRGGWISSRDEMPICSIPCKKKMIALTFDDGFKYMPEILRKLERYHIKATFFPAGEWVEQNPELCRQLSEAGHEIGNHSYSHYNMTELSGAEACGEISRAQQLIEETIGKKCVLFRFPYGASNKELHRLVKEQGLKAVKWSVCGFDWTGINAEAVCENILGSKQLKKGAIVLLHTTHYTTVEALDLLIPALLKKGYQPVKVSDLFHN